MTVFVDTSALFALLTTDDDASTSVTTAFEELADRRLVTHNYVLVEAATLVGRRLGSEFVTRLVTDILAPVETFWVDEAIHNAASSAFLAAGASGPSLVDLTSFEVMRVLGVRTALAVDRDFARAGFDVIPA